MDRSPFPLADVSPITHLLPQQNEASGTEKERKD